MTKSHPTPQMGCRRRRSQGFIRAGARGKAGKNQPPTLQFALKLRELQIAPKSLGILPSGSPEVDAAAGPAAAKPTSAALPEVAGNLRKNHPPPHPPKKK